MSFGSDDPAYGFDPCDYYDYYDEPPPWGMPDEYCDYPVWFEPVFFDGLWYRGPIYYRWTHGHRHYWLNGGWRDDTWTGPRPSHIAWNDRGIARVQIVRPRFPRATAVTPRTAWSGWESFTPGLARSTPPASRGGTRAR